MGLMQMSRTHSPEPVLPQGKELAKSGCCSGYLMKIKVLEDENFSLAKSSSFID